MSNALRLAILSLGLASTATAPACKGNRESAPAGSAASSADDEVRQVGVALAGGRDVMVTVNLEFPPRPGKQNRRVHVSSFQYDATGELARVKCKDGTVVMDLPGKAFRNALVPSVPMTVGGPRTR